MSFLCSTVQCLAIHKMLATSLHQSTLAFGNPPCLSCALHCNDWQPTNACNQPTSVNNCRWKPTMSFLCSTLQCLATHKCLQPAYISQHLPLEGHNVLSSLCSTVQCLAIRKMLATSLHQSTLAFGNPPCLSCALQCSAWQPTTCLQPDHVNTCFWKPTMSFLCSTVQCLATHNVLATIVLISPHMCTQFFGNPKPTCDCNRCADNCFAAHTCARNSLATRNLHQSTIASGNPQVCPLMCRRICSRSCGCSISFGRFPIGSHGTCHH